MPARPVLVREAIARFDTAGLRSQLLKLDTVTLEALGALLADRKQTVADAVRWLEAELGEEGEVGVNKNAVYRFSDHFRRLYGQVRGEHARRIARLSVEHATAGRVGAMARVAGARLVDLVTEKLLDTDDLEQLSGRELAGVIATLEGVSKADFKAQELALKTAEAEQRAQKLAAELDRIKLDLEQRRSRLHAAAGQAKAEADRKAQQSGHNSISREDVYRMIDQVMKGEAA